MTRSQEEILERIEAVSSDDWMGTRRETLIRFLDFDNAKPFLKPEVTTEDWKQDTDPVLLARGYLSFAMDKAYNHRGLSAGRSIEHFKEWAWLSDDPAFTSALDQEYPNYGAPILKAIAVAIGADDVWAANTSLDLERMADGDSCEPGCSGCGA